MRKFYSSLFSVPLTLAFVSFSFGATAGTGFSLRTITSGASLTGTGEAVRQIVTTQSNGDGIDLDNDGFGEIIVHTAGTDAAATRVHIYEATADNTYTERNSQTLPGTSSGSGLLRGVDVGNLDDDAELEIVAASSTSANRTLTMYDISTDGSFTFTQVATSAILMAGSATFSQVRIVDNVNGSTRNDILISNATGTSAHLDAVEYNGVTSFTTLFSITSQVGVIAFDTGNLDGDSDLEVVVLHETTAAEGLGVYSYTTSGFTADGTITGNFVQDAAGNPGQVVDIGDIDGDGDLEAMATCSEGTDIGDIFILYNTGGTSYTASKAVNNTAIRRGSCLGNRDADSSMEIYYSNGNNVVYREHIGSANNFSTTDFSASISNLVTVLGGNASAISFYRGADVPLKMLDGDFYRDIFVGLRTNITGDEVFALESSTFDSSLPVTLTSFTAKPSGKSIQLAWTTESEVNNLGFKIMRSENNEDFNQVASYSDSEELIGQGNTILQTNYTWTDKNIKIGVDYYYYLVDVNDFEEIIEHTDRIVSAKINDTGATKKDYLLKQNHPNPFNPITNISYELIDDSALKITVYNTKGELVRTLINEKVQAGSGNVVWNGTDESGAVVSSGVYFYKMEAGNFVETKKMVYLK
ncbi:T9SS type A sorting domain-containing protein [bacterium]|nr:T9SS type A sorting domain-containing protein [bacterium]